MKKGDYKTSDKAKKYEELRFSSGLKIIDKDEAKILNQFFKTINRKRATFLDVGCGTGRIIREILKYGPQKIYALDASNAMLEVLGTKFSKQINSKIILINAKSDKIPLLKNVDVVTSIHLFKHLRNITPTIKEVYRILKPEGYLIFDVLNKKSVVNLALGDCYAFDENQISKILSENGFKVHKVIFLHSFGETVYNLAGRLIHPVDHLFYKLNLKTGTNMFILAQKNG